MLQYNTGMADGGRLLFRRQIRPPSNTKKLPSLVILNYRTKYCASLFAMWTQNCAAILDTILNCTVTATCRKGYPPGESIILSAKDGLTVTR